MGYIYLAIAIVAEVFGTTCMTESRGFTRVMTTRTLRENDRCDLLREGNGPTRTAGCEHQSGDERKRERKGT